MATRAEREEVGRQYLRSKVDDCLNKLILEILKQKPEDVLGFIHNWSKDELGVGSNVKTEEVKVENTDNIKEEPVPQTNLEENGVAVNTETVNLTDLPKDQKEHVPNSDELEEPTNNAKPPQNDDNQYIVTENTKFKWNKKPMADDDLRKYWNQPTDEMKEKCKAEKAEAKIKGFKPRALIDYLSWKDLTKGKKDISEYKDQIENKNLSEDEYCQKLVDECYNLEDMTYAQYKFKDGFEDNNKDFYERDHWNDEVSSPGGYLMEYMSEFEETSKEKYIWKYSHLETIYRWFVLEECMGDDCEEGGEGDCEEGEDDYEGGNQEE